MNATPVGESGLLSEVVVRIFTEDERVEVWEAVESVAADDQHIAHPAVLQFSEH